MAKDFLYILCIVIIAAGGIPKGYDEGGFSASTTLPSFVNDYNLSSKSATWAHDPQGLATRKANINSFGVLGAAIGSLLSIAANDRFGRLKCWRGYFLLWASGLFIQMFASGNLSLLYFARIWSGLGAGALTVVTPIFLTEIAQARSRGLVVSIFMVFLLTFLSIGFFVSYGAAQGLPATPLQYRITQAVPLIPCGMAFIASFFLLTESPRWLAAQDRHEEAMAALRHIRGGSIDSTEVQAEIEEIQLQLEIRRQTLAGVKLSTVVKEIVTIPSYRRRFVLAAAMQTVAQWSGGNGITYYIPQIFELAGVTGGNTSLVTSGAYGIVKLVFTMVFAWGLVDYLGRRFCFLTGLSMQFICHFWLFLYILLLQPKGSTAGSDIAILSIFVYAVGWSIGLCTVQYIYGTEIFPTRHRNVCYATFSSLRWFFQFAVVYATPVMLTSLKTWGAFLFWACICAVGLVLLGILAPETKRVPMEGMDQLFAGPWYTTYKAKYAGTTIPDIKDVGSEKAGGGRRTS